MIRSPAQQEQSARQMLRNAMAQGLRDDEAIAFAVAALGEDGRAMVSRVWAREFVVKGAI